MNNKNIRLLMLLIVTCVFLVAVTTSAEATPVRKVTYSSYTISSVEGTKFCTVYFSNGKTAYNTYDIKASRDTLNTRVIAFSKLYSLGITQSQAESRSNACYANRVSYKSMATVTINYP